MAKLLRLFVLLTGFSITWGQVFAAITIGETQTNVTCFGGNTGAINLNPTGGSSPYTYHWSDGYVTQTRSNLVAATYDVTVTDNTGATAALAITLTQGQPFFITVTATNETCGGQDIGTLTLNVAGGHPGYTYRWNDGVTTENRTNLTAAVYYVTITDAQQCTVVDSGNVTQPPGLAISAAITNTTCGLNDGAINISVQYGNPAYSYSWGDGSILQNRTGLAIGLYTLTVTDAVGCSSSAAENITSQPGSIAITTASTQPVCNGGNNGSVSVTLVSGGVAPYTYLWGNGTNASSLNGLAAGSYPVTVTSANGCTSSSVITLGQPPAINIQLHAVALTCFESGNGGINTTVSGGVSPYSYTWTGGLHLADIISLQSSTYDVTVTDAVGCSAASSVFVSQPLALSAVATPSPLACSGGPSGSVITFVSGGTPAYTYWWGAGVTTPDRINVNAGNYTVTVTDGNGCTATASANIPTYVPMDLTTTDVNNACFQGSTGTITANVTDGQAPFSFVWNTGPTTQGITGLANGTYTVSVADGHGCTSVISGTITGPPFATVLNATITDVSCNGGNNGSIVVNPQNGNAPFTYNWGGGITGQSRTNLAAGSYNVTTTDNTGCTANSSFTLTQPTPVNITSTETNVTCFAANNGRINITVTGSFSPYTYHWNDGTGSANRSNIAAGNYSLTVTDNRTCTATASMVITQPTQIVLGPVATNVTCNGANTGTINLTVNGGAGGYTYNWGGGVTSQNRTNLTAGTYVVTVTDNTNCSVSASAIISQPSLITPVFTFTNVLCNGGSNGSITTTTTGGVAPYTYNWGGGITSPNNTNLAAGNFTVTVTDFSGCSITRTLTVTQPPLLSVTSVVTNVNCNGGNNGAISIAPVGGTTNYNYNWGGGITTQNRSNLPIGSYTVTVTDANGCTASNSSTITQPLAISVSATTTAVLCNGGNTGAINITPAGGTVPYDYNWGGGITTQNRANLTAGNYTVTLTDGVGCTASRNSVISQPVALNIATTNTSVLCNGGNTGSINVTVTGGTNPYSYNWGGSVVSQNRTTLVAGNYSVTVTDNVGCTATNSTAITQPTPLVITAQQTNELCNGGSNGSITITVAGGTPNYTYNWGSGITTQTRTNIGVGNYAVTITDGNSCTAAGSYVLTQPTALSLALTTVNVGCFGQATGKVNLIVTGGTSGYTYLWNNTSTSQNLNAVASGAYTVTVTDSHLCTATSSANITQPAQINISFAATAATCFNSTNGSVTSTVTGGTAGYTYLWNNHSSTPVITGVAAGNYVITVTDANLCTASGSASVTQPTPVVINTTHTNVSCFNYTNGQISSHVSGGTSPYSYAWSNTAVTPAINNLAASTYILTVTDGANCTNSATVNITQPAAIVVTATPINATCNGLNNGVINLSVTGGAGAYNFVWSNAANTQQISNLVANNYTVTVTDANLCTATQSATITAPAPISLSSSETNYACATHEGTITVTPNGTAPYNFNWADGFTTQNRTNLAAGTYSVTLTDAHLCTVASNITIGTIPVLVPALTASNPTCFNGINGSVNLNVSGGTQPYAYSWNNGATTANISNVEAAQYQIVITDSNSCTASATATVTQPTQIQISLTSNNIRCFGFSDGSIQVNVTGGTPAYTYSWNNSSATANISGLGAGAFQLTVTDANLCATVSDNIVLTQPTQITVSSTVLPIGCAYQTDGSIQLGVSGGTTPYSFSWSNTDVSQNVSGLTAGNYSVTVTDNNGCASNQAYTVTSVPPIWLTGEIKNASCAGASNGAIALNVGGGTPGYTYEWNAGASLNLTQLQAGVYDVTVSDTLGCSAQFSFDVANSYQLEIQAGPSTTINAGQSAQLNVTANVDYGNAYSWAPANTLSCDNCASPKAFPTVNTTYTVSAIDTNGCKAVTEVNIDVISTYTVFIPNVFTPNGDGQNDVFQVFGDVFDIGFMQVSLFNRWGEKVFESNDAAFKWDGIYKAQPAPEGVYVYEMETVFTDGSKREYKGSVTLLR